MAKARKIMVMLTFSLIIMSLFSCREKPVAGPVNLYYDNKTFTINWDKVKKAEYYILDINGILQESLDNRYSFYGAEEGVYRVKIKAILKKQESIYSNTLVFSIAEHIDLVVYSNGTYLYWEEVDEAEYIISYLENLSLKKITVKENRFLIPEILKQGLADITLSVYLYDTLLAEEKVILDYNTTRIYHNDPYIISIFGPSDVFINGKSIQGASIRTDNVRLSPATVSNYLGEIYLSVSGHENIMKKLLVVIRPFELQTFEIQPYTGGDVLFSFRFNDFEIRDIKNLNSRSDYRVEDYSTLVISKNFIENYILNNPGATKIELNLVLVNGIVERYQYLEIDLLND